MQDNFRRRASLFSCRFDGVPILPAHRRTRALRRARYFTGTQVQTLLQVQ
jgi:hypothetical protein